MATKTSETELRDIAEVNDLSLLSRAATIAYKTNRQNDYMRRSEFRMNGAAIARQQTVPSH